VWRRGAKAEAWCLLMTRLSLSRVARSFAAANRCTLTVRKADDDVAVPDLEYQPMLVT